MSKLIECQNEMISLSERQGYLTFDNILDASDTYALSVSEVDQLSEALQLRGIIVYEAAPTADNDYSSDDYGKIDYGALYAEIIAIDPSLEPYVNDISGIQPPQFREVTSLTRQVVNGNAFARERLITSHLRIVLKIALSMSKQHDFELADAISAGTLGLIRAADKFDPDGFSAFQSYASRWIQQQISQVCTPRWMEYYYPMHIREKVLPVFELFESITTGNPNQYQKEIHYTATKLFLSDEDTDKFLSMALSQFGKKTSIESLIEDSDDALDDLLSDVYEEPVVEEVLEEDCTRIIHFLFDKLNEREARVLALRYGLTGEQPKTLEEVGNAFGVTRERIRQIENKAIRKLKHPTRQKYLKDYY